MKRTKLVKGLYIVDALLALLFIYMVISSITYIASYCESYGMTVSSMMGEAISYVITSSIVYLVYAILLFVGVRILDILTSAPKAEKLQAATCDCGCQDELVEAEAPAAEEAGEAKDADKGSVPPIYTSASINF